MSMADKLEVLKSEIDKLHKQAVAFVNQAAQDGTPIHKVELGIWEQLLKLGFQYLRMFLAQLGDGDMGATVTLTNGTTCQRLDEKHQRRYVSIFGEFDLKRVVYGSREGQKIEFVPLDSRLQLPQSVYSYVLQDWDQVMCAEEAFAKVSETMTRMLGLKQQPVDSLEGMNEQMAEQVQAFREDRPMPSPEEEGAILVLSADGKGIVMRREEPPPAGHRTKGEKASQKRMAIVGTAYTVDRYYRSAAEVVAALFRDRQADEAKRRPRPVPQHKHVWASLGWEDEDGTWHSGTEAVYPWLLNEVAERNKCCRKEMVCLHDGQESLWAARDAHLPQRNTTDIVDFLHVAKRLWRAAHAFHKEGSEEAEAMVRDLMLRVLEGKASGVICGLREKATKLGLKGSKKKAITEACSYLKNNLHRMHYDEYLAKGYPIASGVIEGACRHLVKDRMERAGMHWTLEGAQAMLDVRSTYVNGDWEKYQEYRIERETARLYPHRALVEGTQYTLAC